MENISYGIYTIFIAFIIFSVIKNVFFNANQLSRIIRKKYLVIVGLYFSIFAIGITSVILTDDLITYINLDLAFLLMSIPMIFTSIRIDSNDTSAYNKWYYSQKKPGEYKGDSKETSTMVKYYFFNIVFAAVPTSWLGFFVQGELPERACVVTFVVASFLFVVYVLLTNFATLGELIRKNLLYNYLWGKLQNNPVAGDAKIIKEKASELFNDLFQNKSYSDNNDMNKQIQGWIGKKE